MSAERSSALLLSRFEVPYPTQVQHGYYRSKLVTMTSTTNPLIAAAGPVFSLLERFCATQSLPPIHSIRDNIEHEWKSFRSRLSSLNYTGELAIIAEYLLSATLDELIGKTYIRLQGESAQFIAFTPSSYDGTGPQQRFFELVHHMKERTNQYLDLLELAYYCLISGFEGEYHLRADGRHALDNLIQELYELVQKHRVHQPLRLFNEPRKVAQERPSANHAAFWKAALLALGTLILLYMMGQTLLERQAKNLYVEQTQRVTLDD